MRISGAILFLLASLPAVLSAPIDLRKAASHRLDALKRRQELDEPATSSLLSEEISSSFGGPTTTVSVPDEATPSVETSSVISVSPTVVETTSYGLETAISSGPVEVPVTNTVIETTIIGGQSPSGSVIVETSGLQVEEPVTISETVVPTSLVIVNPTLEPSSTVVITEVPIETTVTDIGYVSTEVPYTSVDVESGTDIEPEPPVSEETETETSTSEEIISGTVIVPSETVSNDEQYLSEHLN